MARDPYVSPIRGADGRLLPLPPSARGKTARWGKYEPRGAHVYSSKWFRLQAEPHVAPARAGDRNAKRMLKFIQLECALFLKARRAGVRLRDGITLERDPSLKAAKVTGAAERREARAAGHGRYIGAPCPSCRGTLRYTTDARCASCKPGFWDRT